MLTSENFAWIIKWFIISCIEELGIIILEATEKKTCGKEILNFLNKTCNNCNKWKLINANLKVILFAAISMRT